MEAGRGSGSAPRHRTAGRPVSRTGANPHRRARMPRDRKDPSPYERAGSEAVNAAVARGAPAVLELLADGAPRSKPAIVAALAGRHDGRDVVHALIRLAVTGRVEDAGGRYALAAPCGGS